MLCKDKVRRKNDTLKFGPWNMLFLFFIPYNLLLLL